MWYCDSLLGLRPSTSCAALLLIDEGRIHTRPKGDGPKKPSQDFIASNFPITRLLRIGYSFRLCAGIRLRPGARSADSSFTAGLRPRRRALKFPKRLREFLGNLEVEGSFLCVVRGKLIPEHSEVVHSFKKLAFLVLLALLCTNLRLTLYLLIVQLPPTRVPEKVRPDQRSATAVVSELVP